MNNSTSYWVMNELTRAGQALERVVNFNFANEADKRATLVKASLRYTKAYAEAQQYNFFEKA